MESGAGGDLAFCVCLGTALVADAAGGGGGAAGCSGVRARALTPTPGTAVEVVTICVERAGRTVETGGRDAVDGVRIEGGTVAGFTS